MHGKSARYWILGMAAVVLLGVGWVFVGLFSQVTGADAGNPTLVAEGRQVYDDHCAVCHGANLEGQPNWETRKPDGKLPAPPHNASGHTWHHPDRQLFDITKYGVARFAPPGYATDMIAFEELLSDREIWATLAFIKSTWPARQQRHQARMNVAANGG